LEYIIVSSNDTKGLCFFHLIIINSLKPIWFKEIKTYILMSEINKKMFSPSDKTTVAYQTILFPVDRTEVKNLINKMLKYKILKQLNTMSYKKKILSKR
jgi:hypothetical protein